MNSEVKTLWLEALRSNRYTQGQQFLRREDRTGRQKYCCLGVLCELAVAEHVIPPADRGHNSPGAVSYSYGFDNSYRSLPPEVIEWAGLDSPNPRCSKHAVDDYPLESLAELNDNGYSFAHIADVIEAEL